MCLPVILQQFSVSIHAPRGGSDPRISCTIKYYRKVSIHAPRGGSDPAVTDCAPTSPSFNPRSPWGERLTASGKGQFKRLVSIHAPRGGSDL